MTQAMTRPAKPESPRPSPSNRGRQALLVVGTLVVAAIAAGAWWLGLFTAELEAVSLESTIAVVQGDTSTPGENSTTAADESTETEADAAVNASIDSLAGTWSVLTSDATFVGYRADSQVGEAVGRSSGVSGTLEATDNQITSVTITADMTQFESDSSLRDEHLGDEDIEYNTYPTSTFVLTEAIDLESVPDDGVAVAFSAVGELTVRDITQAITIALEGTTVGDHLIVAGSAEISLDDFGASISGTEDATMEFSLVFER